MSTTFLDLLRAKVAVQLSLLDPAGARRVLKAVDGGQEFLSQLPGDPALRERVDRYARRCEQLRGESFYLRFLREQGAVQEEALHPILWQVRQSASGQTLGETLVSRGLIELSLHEGLRDKTSAALASENLEIARRYRERSYEGVERPGQTVAQVVAEGEGSAPAPAPLPAPTPVAPPPVAALAPALPVELAKSGLDQKYEIIRKAGEGGMGAVYLAYSKDDPDHEQPLALKVVLDVAKSKDAAARFKREILATSFCAHENIIEIHDAAETLDGSYYMAMEYIEGEELADIIKAEGPLELPRLVRLLDQALQALQAAHEANIVHRDIKPQNFRIAKRADGSELLKLVDFGIARVLDADVSGAGDQFYKTMGGKITGSPAYIAPESITEPEVDQKADLYSLGITIFRIATGRLPFVAKAPTEYLPMHLYQKPPKLREVLPAAPESLELMVDTLLAKIPEQRYESTAHALAFLREKVWPEVLPGVAVPGSPEAAAVVVAPPAPLAPPPQADFAPPPPAPLPASFDPLAPPSGQDHAQAPDSLGFTAPELVIPTGDDLQDTSDDIDAYGTPDAGPGQPAPEAAAPRPGFFARIWAAICGK